MAARYGAETLVLEWKERRVCSRCGCLDDYVTENNPVWVIEAFIDELDLATLGFDGVVPETTGRPAYHPATLLKIYVADWAAGA